MSAGFECGGANQLRPAHHHHERAVVNHADFPGQSVRRNTGFCPLTNAGTNNVGLDFGTAAFPGSFHTSACVNYQHLTAAVYQVSSAFDVVVSKSNSSSPNYRLAAQISTPPPANVSWLLNNVTLTTAGFTTLDTADNYATPITKTLQVQVKNTVAAQPLLETITFLATAN